MPESKPVLTLVSYYPKAGKEQELLALIQKHWPTLNELELVSPMRAQIWRASDKRTQQSFFVELFEWKDETSSDIAHQTPEVMAVWETMGPILETLQLTRLEPVE
jgi:hypothetical protein